MTLQQEFTLAVADLIRFAYDRGYTMTWGEAWRPPETVAIYAKEGKGSANSLHPSRLAVDVNLFRDGVWLARTEDFALLGRYWKSLHKAARWGGDFTKRPDGNHFSFTPDGIRA